MLAKNDVLDVSLI